METFHKNMREYKKQLEKGMIQAAYKGLMDYLLDLRKHFMSNYPDYFVSGNIYFGYMDMSYFSVIPESLKERGLKIAVVFLHETFRFEVWLAAVNKQVQGKYWIQLKESDWKKYHLVPTTKGVDSILEYVLVDQPDFEDLDRLTRQIERETLKFICDVDEFLNGQQTLRIKE